jgi:hypothetical protein
MSNRSERLAQSPALVRSCRYFVKDFARTLTLSPEFTYHLLRERPLSQRSPLGFTASPVRAAIIS